MLISLSKQEMHLKKKMIATSFFSTGGIWEYRLPRTKSVLCRFELEH